MTVHRAKGLEFPVVILADLTAKPTPREVQRWVERVKRFVCSAARWLRSRRTPGARAEEMERQHEEGHRLLYVAATRARDLLVVPVVGDAPRPGWITPSIR
jgi:ATP-dependent exoDNAse (exonuclease V) beta subunit